MTAVQAEALRDLDQDILIQANGLGKTFDADDGTTMEIIRSISFSLHRGEIVSIVGPSGCGKTTLAQPALWSLAPELRVGALARASRWTARRLAWAICCREIYCCHGGPRFKT